MTISSCSSNEIEPMTASELAQAKYEQAFIERFGQPAPNQTWGFGTVTKALTRSANTNSNQWFDENQMNLEKPADITAAEREYVMNWFATHTKADEKTFDLNNYFVQQVDYSNHVYNVSNADGSNFSIDSYGHMDQIFANMSNGATDHVNNFNAGSGWIMLMENSETKYGFGYVESYGTDDKDVKNNYLMAEIEVPGIGKGYYVGLDYQAKKSGEGIDLKADGKYDDRVLKIVPAKKKTLKGDRRVIAEDLTVGDKNNDFDFNDVVFDIKFNYPAGKTTIILQAAGGTLPLEVAGKEVHGLFGVPQTTMVNTGGVTKDPVTFELDGTFDYQADKIEVRVYKNDRWVVLTAPKGKVASKICVGVDYKWCAERQDIESKYPNFAPWVKNNTPSIWWK